MGDVRRQHRKDCSGKYKYRGFCEAVRAADDYNEKMGLVEAPMVPYRCGAHRTFHKGHDSWMSERSSVIYLAWSRARSWARLPSSRLSVSAPNALYAEVNRLALARLRACKSDSTGEGCGLDVPFRVADGALMSGWKEVNGNGHWLGIVPAMVI